MYTRQLKRYRLVYACVLNTEVLFIQGATVVKEDLLDDVIKESAPYKPPGVLCVCVCVCVCVCAGVFDQFLFPSQLQKECVCVQNFTKRNLLPQSNPMSEYWFMREYVRMYACMCVCVYVRMYVRVCMYVCMCVCVCVCVCSSCVLPEM